MAQLIAYLSFDGTCKEAMTFYKECLGGELTVQTVGESPMAAQMPADAQGSIMHCALVTGEMTLFASDMLNGEKVVRGNTVTLCITGKNREEIRHRYERLSVGANVTQPLTEEFFGLYGALTDKFGVNWMFQAA